MAALALALGCSDTSGDGSDSGGTSSVGGSGTGGGGSGATAPTGGVPQEVLACQSDGQLVIADSTNYTFSSTLNVESTVVNGAHTDIFFDWSALTTDFFDVPVNPATDIDMIVISLWGQTETELSQNLNKDNLPLSDNKGAATFYPNNTDDGHEAGRTSAHLLEFNSFHNPIPEEDLWARFDVTTPGYEYPPESHTFMIMAATGTMPGKNSRMLGFFRLDANATNTTVALTDSSTQMDWSVDLHSAPIYSVPAGNPNLNIDWSGMTLNALGNEYDVTQITEAVVAHYASMTVADLEQQFLFLEDRADAWYSGDVLAGTNMDLNELTDEADNPFPGIDSTGVWLVALFCTNNCNNPAPWSITLLTPC